MSGGYYGYLHMRDSLGDMVEYSYELRRMYRRLADLGWADDAAEETAVLIAKLDEAEDAVADAIANVADVWKAVEWWDSADWSEEQVRQALADYREETA